MGLSGEHKSIRPTMFIGPNLVYLYSDFQFLIIVHGHPNIYEFAQEILFQVRSLFFHDVKIQR